MRYCTYVAHTPVTSLFLLALQNIRQAEMLGLFLGASRPLTCLLHRRASCGSTGETDVCHPEIEEFCFVYTKRWIFLILKPLFLKNILILLSFLIESLELD